MYSATLLDHFQNPRNVGELSASSVTVEVSNPACGDIMRLSLAVEDGRIRDVRYKTRGCVPAIACGSVLTEMIKGATLEAAQNVSAPDVVNGVGGLPPASNHAAVLAVDALKEALKAGLRS
ncbi:MAG: iron-sulfur cluster assembly scaffold protein [Acidobacteria bacterium]|nr:iron-sulfur cluster assembly scaffold protein [Acidobacteriota bacterium]